jgi:hypothetical protein
MRRLARSLGALTLALIGAVWSSASTAAPCAGFTDLDDTSGFCGDVAWIKNRGVTLGCTSTTLYCPDGNVTRLQMAAFMQRLGAAVLPEFLAREEIALNVDMTAGIYLCTMGPLPIQYRRIAHIDATADLIASTAPASFRVEPVVSFDGGASWVFTNAQSTNIHAPAQVGNGAAISRAVQLVPGDNLAVGVFFSRAAGGADLLSVKCHLRATIFSDRAP